MKIAYGKDQKINGKLQNDFDADSTIGTYSTFADTSKKPNNDKNPPVIELRL